MRESDMRRRFGSLMDLAIQTPQVHDVLSRVGSRWQRRSRAERLTRNAGWFGAGLALGTGLTALLAPRSGAELRQLLARRARRLRDRLTQPEPQREGRAARERGAAAHDAGIGRERVAG